MGILEKALGLGAVAVGGIAAVGGMLGGKEKKLAALDLEFSQTTSEYERKKAKLQEKALKGNKGAQRNLAELEREYNDAKREYEIKRQKYLPKKTKAEEAMELKEMEHIMEMEKLETKHRMEMDKREMTPVTVSPSLATSSVGADIVCSSCGEANSAGAKFCCHCGSQIITKKFCSKCGAKLDSSSKFCSACGEIIN